MIIIILTSPQKNKQGIPDMLLMTMQIWLTTRTFGFTPWKKNRKTALEIHMLERNIHNSMLQVVLTDDEKTEFSGGFLQNNEIIIWVQRI